MQARPRSDFTPDLSCSTLACAQGGGCTSPQDYWRYYNPLACGTHPESAFCVDWPLTSFALGTVSYTVEELVAILNTPASDNGLIALAHQLIAAKLSIAAGADGSAITAVIAAADSLVGALVVPPVGEGTLASVRRLELQCDGEWLEWLDLRFSVPGRDFPFVLQLQLDAEGKVQHWSLGRCADGES